MTSVSLKPVAPPLLVESHVLEGSLRATRIGEIDVRAARPGVSFTLALRGASVAVPIPERARSWEIPELIARHLRDSGAYLVEVKNSRLTIFKRETRVQPISQEALAVSGERGRVAEVLADQVTWAEDIQLVTGREPYKLTKVQEGDSTRYYSFAFQWGWTTEREDLLASPSMKATLADPQTRKAFGRELAAHLSAKHTVVRLEVTHDSVSYVVRPRLPWPLAIPGAIFFAVADLVGGALARS